MRNGAFFTNICVIIPALLIKICMIYYAILCADHANEFDEFCGILAAINEIFPENFPAILKLSLVRTGDET